MPWWRVALPISISFVFACTETAAQNSTAQPLCLSEVCIEQKLKDLPPVNWIGLQEVKKTQVQQWSRDIREAEQHAYMLCYPGLTDGDALTLAGES
jgi:hypothetical protein